MIKKLCMVMAAMAMTFSLGVCTDQVVTPVSAASAKIAKKKTMYVAQKMKLTVVHAKKKVKWSSTNSAVASVKKSGKTSAIITANTAGTAQITAKIGKKKLVCKVTVQNRPVTAWYDDAQANDFVARINAARNGASYSGFTTTDALTQIARAHAAALVTNFAKGSLAANQDEMVLKSNAYYAYTLETGEN